MKKTFITLILAIPFLSACHRHTFEEQVAEDVRHFNEQEAPKRMDMFTTLDSMSYDAPLQLLTYYYTIDADIEDSQFASEDFKGALTNHIRTSIPLKTYKEHRQNIQFKYFSHRSGKVLIDCTFTPEDYE